MISYERFAFFGVPRTGTTWALQVFDAVGLGSGSKTYVHVPQPVGYKGFSVSLVRHPFSWLESIYYALEGGSCGVAVVDEVSKAAKGKPTFRAFVEALPEGAVKKVFDRYEASTVMRLEDMPLAMLEFLESIKVPRKLRTKAIEIEPLNARTHFPFQDKGLRALVVKKEHEFCDRFNYY